MKKILVIDANSIINRAFYGVRPLTTKSGKNTNAIYGMVNILQAQMKSVQPDYVAAAFDIKHPTFRHEMYPEYKAGRHPTPPELLEQFPEAKEILSLMGIKVLELPGWEADDIQGTIAKLSHTVENTESFVLSGDRDLLQLIDEKVTVLLATNKETLIMKAEQFTEKYGVSPSQFVDMKALMGDSSDNIPGVSGIGEKTAASLISNFGSLDGIYESIDDKAISKGVREKLLKDKDNAYLSQKLARIDTNAPIGISLEDIRYEGINKSALYKKFTELELNSFISKFGLDGDGTEEKGAEPKQVTASSSREVGADELNLMQTTTFAVQYHDSSLFTYINGEVLKYSGELNKINRLLENSQIICYDAKSLWHIFNKAGINCDGIRFLDLMLYEYVINPGSGNAGIESLCSMFLGNAIPKDSVNVEFMPELEKVLRDKIEHDGMTKILDEIELPLINVLAATEAAGFKIQPDKIKEFSEALGDLANSLAERIYVQAGEEFNINSPKQLGAILYEKMGLKGGKKGKTGYSTNAETLEEIRLQHPIIDDILEYRQVTKLKGTYTNSLTDVRDENDRIHTDFKQALTATGRLSSAEPNLQNIPIKTKMGREMRRFFIAEEGCSLVDADYSQIELRLLAHISGDYTMSEAFRNDEDIHRKTASAVFGIPEAMVNEEMRKRAKAVNFGIVYGISGFSLAKDIGTSVPEATKYIKNYMMNYPSIDSYLENVVSEAIEKGYTATPLGRRRYIPELKSQNHVLRSFGKRVAMNAPIQGAAADIMKIAMINVYNRLKKEKLKAKIVMQVHDELIVECPDSEIDAVKTVLQEEMQNAVSLDIPLTVDVTSGKNWLEQF